MNIFALWIGKIVFLLLSLIGRRGAALPGLLVEKLAPNFLDTQLSKLPEGALIVVGTNGKTTTTKMLTHVLRSKYRVLTNPTGSNFTRGVIASIVENAGWNGALPFDIAVLELDEAYGVKFVELHRPRGVIVLNVMRDQMDRFAEIDQTAAMLATVATAAQGFVVLNNDDRRISEIAKAVSVPTSTFGVASGLQATFVGDDDLYAKDVKKMQKSATVLLETYKKSQATYLLGGNTLEVTLASEGAHNAQNAAAVLAACAMLNFDIETAKTRLGEVRPAFGRGEMFALDDKKLVLQLVKNPGGFRHALLGAPQNAQVLIAVNDGYPDGRDVSWLWDVSFDGLKNCTLATTGVRASDMALRLKYDDITTISVNDDLEGALKQMVARIDSGATGVVYATYTAMLALREHLAEMTEVERV